MYDLHGTECSFVHKRILGAAVGLVTGGPSGAISGFVGGGGGGGGSPCGAGFVRGPSGNCVQAGSQLGLSGRGGGFGGSLVSSITRQSREEAQHRARPGFGAAVARAIPFGDTGRFDPGAAVMGQWGAALEPAAFEQITRRCIRGMVLGTDGLCYNKPLANNKRMWPLRKAATLKRSKSSKKLLKELGFK